MGKLCIKTFADLNGNGVQDTNEPAVPGLVFHVFGTDPAKPLKRDQKGGACSELPVGTYTVAEQLQGGWIETTPATQTITIISDQSVTVLFGSRQGGRQDTGKLCIWSFDDLNGNGLKDAGEPNISGFSFQLTKTATAKPFTTELKESGCSELPVGKYMVAEITRPGWSATTSTKQPVVITANQRAELFFGNRKTISSCSDADKNRETEIIINRYWSGWLKNIEAERGKIIVENSPGSAKNVEATLEKIGRNIDFISCTAASVVIKYQWLLRSPQMSPKTVSGKRTFVCEKTGSTWICR